jgi:AraC family transcriptional regulator of arabinose operon
MNISELADGFFFGEVVYPPGGTYGPVLQPRLQLVFIHSGRGEHLIDGRWHLVEPGEAIALLPGERVEIRFDRLKSTHHTWCQAALPAERAGEARAALPARKRKMSPTLETLLWLGLGRAHQTGKSPQLRPAEPPPSGDLRAALVRAALEAFFEPFNPPPANPTLIRHDHRHADHPALRRLFEAIERRLDEPLTLRDLAHDAALSPQHLMRLCREAYQRTPTELLWEARVEVALRDLRQTGLSITEIAQRTGFKTPEHFSRRIKQATGQSPRAYRQREWAG